jgi:hypothetical protein
MKIRLQQDAIARRTTTRRRVLIGLRRLEENIKLHQVTKLYKHHSQNTCGDHAAI